MLDILTKDKAVAVVCLSYSKFEKKYSVKERIKLLPLMWIRDFIFSQCVLSVPNISYDV